MKQTEFIWVDTDVLCLSPLYLSQSDYCIGWSPWRGEINNAVMRMPVSSSLYEELNETINDMRVIPSWLKPGEKDRLKKTPIEDRLTERYQIKRTILGPACLTNLGKRHLSEEDLFDSDVLYPVPWQFSDVLFNPGSGTESWITSNTCVVHLWSHMIRRHKRYAPYPNSFLGTWVNKLGMENQIKASVRPPIM